MSARPLAVLLLLAGLATTGCTVMSIVPMVPELAGSVLRTHSVPLGTAYDLIDAGKFDQAEEQLRDLERDTKPTPLLTSEIAFIRALSIERQGRVPEAVEKYRAVVADHPHTPDAYLAAKKIRILEAKTKPAEVPATP